ncbi:MULTISPECIES: siderophore-interacting protein [Aliiglaciecola]|uniref:siderophore-interacting protein n=1 Tax=Aliiglaciecola TaxID=1406885 RepID=UPI001C0A3D9A|nr:MULTISPECIES: siderophore-interacting protein [Aliiglaciecola]MBU2876608.1 siderophore-interacting protein [Aliiglaciecola lipolytica]MDO6711457.1 siderophore-interacting protein [Aliiglaciecola sp. 2_MG-2023]MDO6752566.1 siderophore-interacting protein [Aliiglaciecola sp. 1_MG-2023]
MGPRMRMTTVKSVIDLSPHMRRIVLAGDELVDFPNDKKSAHVKAIFPNPNSPQKMPKLGMYIGFKKWMRSYTVRDFDSVNSQLTLDFAVHDHQGLASNWAANAKPGDYLGIAGPGDTKHPDLNAANHLFFGDITALPAIAGTLEQLPKNAQGKAWIQVPELSDKQALDAPEGIKINWFITPDKLTKDFLSALSSQPRELRDTAIFIAAEASIVRQLKAHLNEHCQYDKNKLYASAYWNQKK